jgi:hypothetical protein
MSTFLCRLGFLHFEYKRNVFRCIYCKWSQRGPIDRRDDLS